MIKNELIANIPKAFATRLKTLREEKQLSQEEFGSKIGISRGSVSFYEKQSRTPDIVVLGKISEFFDVTLDYLLGFSDNRTHQGIVTERIIGISDTTINCLKKYTMENTQEELDILNYLIQSEDTMYICSCLSRYLREYRKRSIYKNSTNHEASDPVITHAVNIILMLEEWDELDKYTFEDLKIYLESEDLDDDILIKIDQFIKNYISISTQIEKNKGLSIQLMSHENKEVKPLLEAIDVFYNNFLRYCTWIPDIKDTKYYKHIPINDLPELNITSIVKSLLDNKIF